MKVLNEREKTHGRWIDQAALAQWLKESLRFEPNWANLNLQRREAIDSILMKISRIVCGDGKHKDHWTDIAGYAELGGGYIVGSRPKSIRNGKALAKKRKSKAS